MGIVQKILMVMFFFTILSIALAQSDTTSPVISSISVSNTTHESAVISWATDENASSEVEYGKDTNYGSSVKDASLNTSHKISLSGLSGSTTYNYRVKSKDSSGNEAVSNDDKFTTSAAPDTTAPTVGSASPTSITADKEVTFSATVSDNVGVKSCLLLKDGTSYTATVSAGTASYKFVSGLPEGSYSIYFECKDEAGNVGKGASVTVTASTKQSLQITITLPKTTYYPVENFEPKLTITDSSGKLIVDATIKSNITGAKKYYPNFFYSSLCDCYKGFQWFDEGVLAGDYTLFIEASHPNFKATTASVAFKVVKPAIQTFTITTDKKEYLPGESIKLSIAIKDSLGNFIKDAHITGEIREADTGNLVTTIHPYLFGDAYTYTYIPATPAISPGSESLGKTYKISVSTTWKEQKATADTTVSVVKKGLNGDVVIEKNVLSPGDILRGKIKVYDKDGNIVKDAKIEINIQSPEGIKTGNIKYLTATFKEDVYEIEPWKVEDWIAVGNYTLEIKIHWYSEEFIILKSIEITKQNLNVDVFLDRTSYKPGDRIYIKILVTYPNGTVAKDAWVSGEIFPLIAEPFSEAATSAGGKESYKPGFCRIYPSFIPPIFYKGEFIPKYFINSPYISSDCPSGKYVLRIKVSATGYTDTEISKEFDVALAKLFIETGFSADSQVDSVNLAIYAEVKDENGKAIEFTSVDGILRSAEEFKGCIKHFNLGYDTFLKRYVGNQFLSRYECPAGNYIVQVKASSTSYEAAEVVQGLTLQYKQGYEYRSYVPATPSESACKEVSCGPDCVQRICEPVTSARECYNFVINDECVNACKEKLEKVEKEGLETVDFKKCIDECTVKVPCQGSAVPAVPIELMIEKLNELKKEVAETKEEVSGLKQMLLVIIDFINSILSKYLGQQQAITIPSEVVANATNTTSPISGAFSAVIKTILRQ